MLFPLLFSSVGSFDIGSQLNNPDETMKQPYATHLVGISRSHNVLTLYGRDETAVR